VTAPSSHGSVVLPLPTDTVAGDSLVVGYLLAGGDIDCGLSSNYTHLANMTMSVDVYAADEASSLEGSAGLGIFVTEKEHFDGEVELFQWFDPSLTSSITTSQVTIEFNECGDSKVSDVSEFTMEAWFKTVAIQDQGNPSKGCCWPFIQIGTVGLSLSDGGEMQFETSSPTLSGSCSSLEGSRSSYGVDFRDEQWHHIAGTFKDNIKTYIMDGVVIHQQNCSDSEPLSWNDRSLSIGNRFDGWIDEVRVWRTALSLSSIEERRHRTLRPDEYLDTSQMVAYFNFDDASSTSVRDLSGNGWDITFGKQTLDSPAYLRNLPVVVASDAPVTGGPHAAWVRDGGDISFELGGGSFHSTSTSFSGTGLSTTSNATHITAIKDTDTHTAIDQTDPPTVYVTYGASKPLQKIVLLPRKNSRPLAGHAGDMLLFDGLNDFGYAKDFEFPMNAIGNEPYTIEWWSWNREQARAGTVYSVGNSEVYDNWCGRPNDDAGRFFCVGRFLTHMGGSGDGNEMWSVAGWDVSTGAGRSIQAVSTTHGSWTHWAIVSEGAGNNGKLRTYSNGELVSEVDDFYVRSEPTQNGVLNGLYLGHWPFWGATEHFFHGAMDEFRVWGRNRSNDEIRDMMHSRLEGTETDLLVYYNFDSESGVSNENGTVSAELGTKDISPNRYDLTFGSCIPLEAPYCKLDELSEGMTWEPAGKPSCISDNWNQYVPKVPCYGEGRIKEDQIPLSTLSSAPVAGGTYFPLSHVKGGGSNITISLSGIDPDGDLLWVVIATDPSRGTIYRESSTETPLTAGERFPITDGVVFVPQVGSGGSPYDSFSYRVTDGILTSVDAPLVQVSVECAPGTFVNQLTHTCDPCPIGTVSDSFDLQQQCTSCPIGSVQPLSGQTSCVLCPLGTFMPFEGRSKCFLCSDYDFPSPCLPTHNLEKTTKEMALGLSGVSTAITVGLIGFITVFRTNRLIVSSSYQFLLFVCIGLIFLSLSAVLMAMDQTASTCTLKTWFGYLGATLVLGSLFLKSYRLDRIFNSSKLHITPLTNTTLSLLLSSMVFFDLLLLSIWEGISPFHVDNELQRSCDSDVETSFTAILMSSKVLLSLSLLFFLFKTKDVPALFNETSELFVGLGVCFFAFTGGAIASFVIPSSFSKPTVVATETICLWVGIVAMIGCVFGVKAKKILFPPKSGKKKQRPKHQVGDGVSSIGGLSHLGTTAANYTRNSTSTSTVESSAVSGDDVAEMMNYVAEQEAKRVKARQKKDLLVKQLDAVCFDLSALEDDIAEMSWEIEYLVNVRKIKPNEEKLKTRERQGSQSTSWANQRAGVNVARGSLAESKVSPL